jgi:hypothetical protein
MSNQRTTNYDTSILTLRDNKYEQASYTNDGYDTVTLSRGTLLGRVATTDKVVPLFTDNADGSQYPVGILLSEQEVEAGETININMIVAGEVAQELIVLNAGDTFEAVVDSRRLKDWIKDMGVFMIAGTELSGYDNQ